MSADNLKIAFLSLDNILFIGDMFHLGPAEKTKWQNEILNCPEERNG